MLFRLSGLLAPALVLAATAVAAAPAAEKARVVVHPGEVLGPLAPQLFGVNLNTGDRARIADPKTLEAVDRLQLGSVRFPNGCEADLYNWKKPAPNQVTVDEFLAFCDRIGAEPYYTINLQGGTEGREGAPPAGASLDERIAFRHAAPNPCGYTNYWFGTLAETLDLVRKHTIERALAGKRPILSYEMGNENWGQAFSDWPPDVYARTIGVYATAMRETLAKAAAADARLAGLALHITAVGFPMTGNNQKDPNTPDYKTNAAWAAALNDLRKRGVIDAVQEHFYAYGAADGGTLAWVTHNLANIFDARLGRPNPRLNGWLDPKLAYAMPVEITEWNVKCWGTAMTPETIVENPGFEDGLKGWTVAGGGIAKPDASGARRGAKGLRVEGREGGFCEVTQRFKKGEYVHASAGVWVRTGFPPAVQVFLRAADDANRGKPLGAPLSPPNASMWQRVVAGGNLDKDVTEYELVLRVEGRAVAFFDEVQLHSVKSFDGLMPLSAETYEQQLYSVEALRTMAENGVRRAHIHHLFGTYPCGLMNGDGTARENWKAFELFGHFRGDEVVRTECEAGTYRHDHAAKAYATDFNALAPAQDAVPAFTALATKSKGMLYLLLVNRRPDRAVNAEIDLGAAAAGTARVRTLSGTDLDVAGAKLEEGTAPAGRHFTHTVPPLAAQVLGVKVEVK